MYDMYLSDTRQLVYSYETMQDLIGSTQDIQDDAYLRSLVIYGPEGVILGDDVVAIMRGGPIVWK